MLSTTVLEKLNKQVNLEAYSLNLYLQMSSWLLSQSLDNTALFFRQHAEEEKTHMMKLFDYINETGALAVIGTIEAPQKTEYASLIELLDEALQHECAITGSINKLVELAFDEKDYSTFAFLQWYVAEQHEEEHLFQSLLHKAKIINTMDGRALFRFDEEVRKSVFRDQGQHQQHSDHHAGCSFGCSGQEHHSSHVIH